LYLSRGLKPALHHPIRRRGLMHGGVFHGASNLTCVLLHQCSKTCAFPFSIQISSAEPINRQIVEQVRRHVASGQWKAGEELPSVGALAVEHAINPMTVSKAYCLLEAEGLLERRRELGMVIADVRPASRKADRLSLLEPALRAAAQQAKQLGLGADQAQALFAKCLDDEGIDKEGNPR
jgi:GntR family transcriptional regulator